MNMQHSRQVIVDKVMSWLGCHEGDATHKHIIDVYNAHIPLAKGYKVKYTDKWCATTVSAAAIECGYTDIIPIECSCNRMIALAQKMGIWQESDEYIPKKADIVLYDWDDNGVGDNKGIPDHTGYVVSDVIYNRFEVCEGNKSDGVNLRNMSVNGKYIRGYITPKYDDKGTVATPNTAIRPPKKYKFGMDVSSYQGTIDFAKVKNEGIQFAILRATVKDQSPDQYFERNLSECIKYKIPASVYKYSRALTIDQARAEAQGVIKALKGRKLLVWYDLEDNTQTPLGKTGIQIIANTFMTELFNAGIACGIYCNMTWYNNLMSDYLKNNVAFWIARYKKDDIGAFDESHKPTGIKNLYGWQYTSKGSLSGITGNVDLDINLM